MNAPKASMALARMAVKGVKHAQQRARSVIRLMAAAYAPSIRVAWAVGNVCPAPGAGRHVWAVANANAITSAPLANNVPQWEVNASAVRATRDVIATAVPLATSAIRSAGAAAAMQLVPLHGQTDSLLVTRTVNASANHSWWASSAIPACRAHLAYLHSIPRAALAASASDAPPSASRVHFPGATYACRRLEISASNNYAHNTCPTETLSTLWWCKWRAASPIARMRKYSE